METLRPSRNTTYLTFAHALQKLLAFGYFALIARFIGAEGVGKFAFVISLMIIFGVFIDFGLNYVLTRELARERDKTEKYLGNAMTAKLVLAVLIYFVLAGFARFVEQDGITQIMIYLVGIVMILDAFSIMFYAVLRGFQNLRYESTGMVINQVIVVTVGTVGLVAGLPLPILVVAVMAGSVFHLVYSYFILRFKADIQPRFTVDRGQLNLLFRLALPFAVAGVFTRIYGYIDIVFLKMIAGPKFAGYYGAAYKIPFALHFIPGAMAAAIYPAMSAAFIQDKKKLAEIFEKSVFYLCLVAVPVTAGILVLASNIILLIYGEKFLASILPLQIVIAALVFIFLNFVMSSALNATNRQTQNTINMGIAMAVSVAANLIFIPVFREVGSAIAAFSSSLVLFVLGLYFASQMVDYRRGYLLARFLKIVISAAAMATVIIFLKPLVHFLMLIPVGAIIYFVCLLAIRGLTKEDIMASWLALTRKEL